MSIPQSASAAVAAAAPAAAKPSLGKRLRELVGVVPAYAWFVFLLLLPLVYIVVVSFGTAQGAWGFTLTFSLANYQRILEPMNLGIIGNSFLVAGYTTVLTLLLGYPFAYFLSRLKPRVRLFALVAVELPYLVSSVIRIYGWDILLATKGVINTLLQATGLTHEPIQMLYTDGAVLMGTIYTLLPLMILPTYNAIEKIDREYVAAARDLGASPWRAFVDVIVRGSASGILSGCLMVFVPSVGLFYVSDMLGGSNTVLLGNLIKSQYIESHNWPFGSALAVIMTVATIAFIVFGKRATKTDRIEVL